MGNITIKPEKIIKLGRKVVDWAKLKYDFMNEPDITLTEFLKKRGMSINNNKTLGWVTERTENQKKRVEELAKKEIQKGIDGVSEVRQRQAFLARFLQMKGAEKLKDVKPGDISEDDARKLAVTGMQEERRALGMENNGSQGGTFTQVNINAKTNFDKLIESLDYEGLLKFIADIKRERARRTIQQNADNKSGQVQEGEIV